MAIPAKILIKSESFFEELSTILGVTVGLVSDGLVVACDGDVFGLLVGVTVDVGIEVLVGVGVLAVVGVLVGTEVLVIMEGIFLMIPVTSILIILIGVGLGVLVG